MPQPPISIPLPESSAEVSQERNHNPYIVAAILALSIVVLLFYRLSGTQSVPGEEPSLVGLPKSGHSNHILVDVDGAVVRPGVYRLRVGSRVFDAIASAGGLKPEADKLQVNMAQKLRDEQKLIVPVVGQVLPPESTATPSPSPMGAEDEPVDLPPGPEEEPGDQQPLPEITPAVEITPTSTPPPVAVATSRPKTESPAPPASPSPSPSAAPVAVIPPASKVSINRATADQLEGIPGVGAKLALDIVSYRKGPPPHAFTSLEELTSVPGLKQAKYEEISPYLKL